MQYRQQNRNRYRIHAQVVQHTIGMQVEQAYIYIEVAQFGFLFFTEKYL